MKGVIDRFEEEYAVIVLDDGKIKNIKKDYLPLDAKEGDVVVFDKDKVYIDKEDTLLRKHKMDKYLDLWED
ncbi:Protein of unknown function [Caloramator fervidus]|uniref:DUF3006 domain-containing protein n=1 Tax=Caloramator fervidus TaxID=29344 RepID=A0A1H5RMV7_9CLOT|nr:DUF3006 domain-containing protein [Caloramator fervidus]SEF38841.1 Protein of unknown function [Caloramator fervidus]